MRRLTLVTAAAIGLLVALGPLPSVAQESHAPVPTRWVHPEGAPRPAFLPPPPGEPLAVSPVRIEMAAPGIRPPAKLGRVAVVIEDRLYEDVAVGLVSYLQSLTTTGYETTVQRYASGSAEELRAYLAGLYQESAGLVGVVLIGNLPYILFETMNDFGGDRSYEDFPCDLFYMDLDGEWRDCLSDGSVTPGNGKYDTHTGNTALEIWSCRLRTDRLTRLGGEVELLNNYFAKLRDYRRGDLTRQRRGLVYDDDDWSNLAAGDRADLEKIYGAGGVAVGSDAEATTAADYRRYRLPLNQEFVAVRSHGYPGGHGFYRNSRTNFEYVFSSEYADLDPPGLFYSFFVCSGSDFTADNYLAGTAIFNRTSGLVSWGSTKTGGMWDAGVFYDELADGRCVGEAFRTWFNDILGRNSETTVHSWWYGMVINGDATLTPRAPAKPRYFLTVLTEGGGTCTPGSAYYDDGSSVSLRAEPAAGWHFRRWTGAVTGENPLATVHMDANKSVTAIFEADADAYDLVLRVEGSGTTSPAPGRHSLEAGRAVSVSAAAAAGWRFVRWSGDLAGTEPALSLRVDRSRTLTATFEPDIGENTLTMDVEGEGSTDPAVGAHTFTNGTTVTLRARPGLGWYFKTWHGDLDSSVNPVELTLSSSRHVTAVFTQSPMYQFTVATDGEGTVTPAPGAYAAGTKLSVTATPAAGWQFARWLGQLSTKVANATVTLDKDTSVIAVFVPVGVPKRVLAVTAASDGGVVSPPGGSFDPGTVVSIQAAPADGFRVRAWRGSDDDPSPGMTRNTVTMNEDREVMVEFEAVPETQYLLTAQVQGGHGTVRPEYQYCRAGNRVLIEANPDPGYRLAAWSGTDNDGSTELLNYATMDAARAVTVTFTMADAGSAGPSGAGDEGESLLPVTGCFIATAAYGSLLDPEVVDLCRFRDRWLMKNKLGRRLVKVYYRLSPPVAAEIARHPSMRLMVRIWLSPIVWVVSHPSGSVSVVMLFATLLLHRRIKRSARGPLALRVPIDPPRRR